MDRKCVEVKCERVLENSSTCVVTAVSEPRQGRAGVLNSKITQKHRDFSERKWARGGAIKRGKHGPPPSNFNTISRIDMR